MGLQAKVIIICLLVLAVGAGFTYQELKIKNLQVQLSTQIGTTNELQTKYDTSVSNFNALKLTSDLQSKQVQQWHDASVALQTSLDSANQQVADLQKKNAAKVQTIMAAPAPTDCTAALAWLVTNTQATLVSVPPPTATTAK